MIMFNLINSLFSAEQIGFYKTNMELASPSQVGDRYVPQIIPNITIDEIFLSPTKKVNISLIQRGYWSNDSFMHYVPPKLDEYTIFTVKQHFFIFSGNADIHLHLPDPSHDEEMQS